MYTIQYNTITIHILKMGCDYYTEKQLIINYISQKGQICTIITNTIRGKGYINVDDYDEDNDVEFLKRLEKKINKKTYIKIIYENKFWIKDKYQKKYEEKLRKKFPEIKEFIKIYRDSIAWAK